MAKQRKRRTSEAARLMILEAAEKRLAAGGPNEVRVQRIAADLELTDAAIYHHFGNREGLLDALARFGAKRLKASMEQLTSDGSEDGLDVEALTAQALDTFERRGYSHLILWLAMSGIPSDRGSGMFESVVNAFGRSPGTGGNATEARYFAALLVMVCAAEPMLGTICRRSVGLGGGRPTTLQFRKWFARWMAAELDGEDPA